MGTVEVPLEKWHPGSERLLTVFDWPAFLLQVRGYAAQILSSLIESERVVDSSTQWVPFAATTRPRGTGASWYVNPQETLLHISVHWVKMAVKPELRLMKTYGLSYVTPDHF